MSEVFDRIRYRSWWHQNTVGGKVAFFFLWFKFIPRRISDAVYGMKKAAQKTVRGFSDDEVFELFHATSKFIYPRLLMFRDLYADRCPDMLSKEIYPGVDDLSEEQEIVANARWKEILDSMVFAFGQTMDDHSHAWSESDRQKIEDGHALFAKYFFCLWD